MRVALSSVAFSGLALAILAVVRAKRPALMPDPRLLISRDPKYFLANYRLIFVAFAVFFALSLLLAFLWYLILARWTGTQIRQESGWSRALKKDRPRDCETYVRLRLEDGLVYSGLVAHFSPDLSGENREIVLAQPMAGATAKNPRLTSIPPQYQRLVIRGSSIVSMSVEYRGKAKRETVFVRWLRQFLPSRLIDKIQRRWLPSSHPPRRSAGSTPPETEQQRGVDSMGAPGALLADERLTGLRSGGR
jgi:hypothetical protein